MNEWVSIAGLVSGVIALAGFVYTIAFRLGQIEKSLSYLVISTLKTWELSRQK
jgi:hypothetical protein